MRAMPSNELPFVTIIIPVKNEEQFLRSCLACAVTQDYPQELLEVFVVDGESTDRSLDIAGEFARNHPNIKVLHNPKGIQAAAMNIGLHHARGDVILRWDAHTTYAPDYVSSCVELLMSSDAANVGGVQVAVGKSRLARAIAAAMTSPVGVGDARFRYAQNDQWVDSVYLGAWRRDTLLSLGGFDESWRVNEDYELNYRLRAAGGRILVSPRIRCEYHVRRSLPGLAVQYFRYGFWRAKTVRTYPDSLKWRHLAPPGLVGFLLASLAAVATGHTWGATVPILYLAVLCAASLRVAGRRSDFGMLPLLPVVLATMHLAWGTGFLIGMAYFNRFVPPKACVHDDLTREQGQ